MKVFKLKYREIKQTYKHTQQQQNKVLLMNRTIISGPKKYEIQISETQGKSI